MIIILTLEHKYISSSFRPFAEDKFRSDKPLIYPPLDLSKYSGKLFH